MKYLSLVLCFVSQFTFSQSYLCVGEAGAGVENGGNVGIQALIYDVSKFRLRLTDEHHHDDDTVHQHDRWRLIENNDSSPIFENCESQYRCIQKEGFFGVFYMTKEHVFTYVIQKAYGADLSWRILYSIKGRCNLSTE